MANHESITDLQAVDFGLGKVLGDCFTDLAIEGPDAFKRFVKRKISDKIFYVKNTDVQELLGKYARRVDDKKTNPPDLPIVAYYRDFNIAGDSNQHTQVIEAQRYTSEERGTDEVMRITTIPIALNYTVLFLTWDRATLDRMCLAWVGYIVPLHRKRSRYLVRYDVAGDIVEVPCNISTPRDILTSAEDMPESGQRLWGAKVSVEVTTQALYGAKIQIADQFDVIGQFEVVPHD